MSTENVKNYYDKTGENYNSFRSKYRYFKRIGRREQNFVLNNIPEGSKVLEIGPGTGFFTQLLVKRASQVTAIDISDAMVTFLKDILPTENLVLQKLGIENVDELDDYGLFDSVVCMRVLPHVDDPVMALRKIKGALHQNGNAVFDFWGKTSIISILRKLRGSSQKVFTKYYDYSDIIKMLNKANLEIQSSWAWGYPGLGFGLTDFIGYKVIKSNAHAYIFNVIKS